MNSISEMSTISEYSGILDLSHCQLCPRRCGVDRVKGETGFCGETARIRAARAALHFDEEPVISGRSGSGAVFFTGCSLGCVFCQNTSIAHRAEDSRARYEVTTERLTDIFLSLQEQGAANINLVTPTHFVPLLIPALKAAKKKGLHIPVVYNTGSYERPKALRALEGLVDIWLADLKYVSPELSAGFSHAPDYWEYASASIAEMVRQCPSPLFSDGTSRLDAEDDADDPLMVRGVIVRHLALPGCADDSKKVLRYLHRTYGDSIFISLMNQYTPNGRVAGDPQLGRRLSPGEYDALVDYAIRIGVQNGFIQEEGTATDAYVPSFDGTGVIPPAPSETP